MRQVARPHDALRPDVLQIGPTALNGEPVAVNWSGLDP